MPQEGGSSPLTRGALMLLYPIAVTPPDHPRLRGVHDPVDPTTMLTQGSSPLTRGARREPRVLGRHQGIIPAYAGCTAATLPKGWLESGSSPLTRGAPRRPCDQRFAGRIIPAYAGCTPATSRPDSRCADHPRLRGVHMLSRRCIWRVRGSSPLTRGARLRVRKSLLVRSDHPRLRGVHGW